MQSVAVRSLADRFHVEVLAGQAGLDRIITKPQVHRPGLEFVGYFDFFPQARVQVLGKKEINYLHSLTNEERNVLIGNIVKYHPPCFVVTSSQTGLHYLMEHCENENIPLLRTEHSTTKFIGLIDSYLTKSLAEEVQIHGGCVNVAEIGILIRGSSGVGKSETAMTLIRRGDRLVADDAVALKKIGPETIIGTHDGKTKEFIALRSVGLTNVVRIYGRGAFQEETRIVLDIELTPWKENELYNELELEERFTTCMDVKIPYIQISLQSGRDVAGLVEAAANNWTLKLQGYSAIEELMQRMQEE